MTPPAAVAVIRAAVEQAHLDHVDDAPEDVAHAVAHALTAHGWTITPTHPTTGPHTAA
ncbi:hypothetical protein PV318_03170 [Streptomyces sp. ME02-6991-2B]|nr:hypothetical protein [Streptomyces sp. ME02-6991-2B]